MVQNQDEKTLKKPYLTSSEEDKMVGFLILMCHGKTKRKVIDIVRMEKEGEDLEKCKFNGEGWWHGFVRRHPKLSLCTIHIVGLML